MYSASIRRLLELYPAGASQEQLLWRLKVSGVRATSVDILQSLNELSANGEIRIIAQGRWVLSRLLAPEQHPLTPSKDQPYENHAFIKSVWGKCERLSQTVGAAGGLGNERQDWRLQEFWRQVLSYYAATQKADPRGRITQFADRHGVQWQLFVASGEWWQNARLSFELPRLGEEFREALMKRSERTCAVGYPVTTVETNAGVEFLPAMLLPAYWQIAGDHLVIEIEDDLPAINPDWLRRVTGRTSWKAEALVDALFPAGEDEGLDAVARRMRNALASFGGGKIAAGRLDDQVATKGEGLRNAAAIFLPTDSSYTQGAARDLELISTASESEWQRTALCSLFGEAGHVPDRASSTDVVQLRDMTDRQFTAASAILNAPISLIQGPPGTGKSDIVVSSILSAVLAGKTVLFASRNHQALDEVETRLRQVCGEVPILTRGRDAEGGRDTDFLSELRTLAATEPRPHGSVDTHHDLLSALVAPSRAKASRLRRTDLELRLAATLDRLLAVAGAEGKDVATRRVGPGLGQLILAWIARVARWRLSPPSLGTLDRPLRPDASVAELRKSTRDLRSELDRFAALKPAEAPEAIAPLAGTEDGQRLVGVLRQITGMSTADRQGLIDRIRELEFSGASKAKDIQADDARILLGHRPCWAVSTLSVPSRIPLVPALFDLLIIDEASQCDIASALPLFYRARRAAVVGDPMQLSFVPQLSLGQEHALMDAAGVPKSGRWRIAQSRTSLFDFVATRPCRSEHFLADQFRSAPGIIDYLNDRFYDGRLVGRLDDDKLRTAPGYKPGLAWVDVKGQTSRLADENVNEAEASEVVRRVSLLASDSNFSGSIGVLSPFNGQVSLIRRRLGDVLQASGGSDIEIKVATIDKFQGGEADVIFFSPVVTESAGFGALSFIRKEHRRLNVAVSRARSVCVVVGDLAFARSSGIHHLKSLARFATEPYSPPRPPFDSVWERKLYQAMLQRGLEPEPQYAVGRRYLDFALFKGGVQLDVEVDGRAFHTDRDGNRKISDRLRDAEMAARGWRVRRFWVSELDRNMEKCLDLIVDDLERA